MLADLLRPLWAWALWSPKRVAITFAILCAVITLSIRVAGATEGHHPRAHAAAIASPASTGLTPTPTVAASPSASPAASPSPPGAAASTVARKPPRAAVLAVRRFADAWVSHGHGWLARMRPYADRTLMSQFANVNPTYLPATAVTGRPVVTGQAAGVVDYSVPTNAGAALITVKQIAGRWLAEAVIMDGTGD